MKLTQTVFQAPVWQFILTLVALGPARMLPGAPPTTQALPKVVLLGDSIREGYAPRVAELLAGRATVVTPKANGRDTATLLKNLDEWAIRERPDLIHFNCGIHDTKRSKETDKNQVSPEQYEANLREIVRRLRAETQARVVFALSTPIIDERAKDLWTTRSYRLINASIAEYNQIALRVMNELDVPVNDLPAKLGDADEIARLHDEGGVHFTPEGSGKLAEAVAAFVTANLPATTSTNAAPSGLRSNNFDADPNWEKFGETASGAPAKLVTQDFGWRASNKAGGAAPGEIGGIFDRSLTRAVYWMKIPEKTLNDKLTLSGRFAVPRTANDSGMQIGFFNETSTGWRTPNSLVFRFSGEDKKDRGAWSGNWRGQFSWAFVDLATCQTKGDGLGALDGNVYQTTKTPPIKSDGRPHDFAISYDPDGAGGLGEISVTIDGTTWKAPLEAGHKQEGATFNRLGLMNLQTSGDAMEAYFADLRLNGELIDLASDPQWEGSGNNVKFEDRDRRPWHDLRWSHTNIAGGAPGEIAITMWRDEHPAYYADKVGPLTLDDELYAEGDLAFTAAGSDSGVYLGWFNSDAKRNKTVPDASHPPNPKRPQESLLAIAIEGPSRIGHYFRPLYSTMGAEVLGDAGTGPIIRPDGRRHHWTLHYDPQAAEGNGLITVMLDEEKTDFELKPGARKSGATFDRFGFFDIQSGGHHVKISLDNVKYTAAAAQ